MPKVRTPDVPFRKMRRLLLGYEIKGADLAEILGCGLDTARRRLDNPETFTLAELYKVATKGHVPVEELRDAFVR